MFAVLGGREFPTKTALARACREVLYKYPYGIPIIEDHSFLCDLFRRSPSYAEKIGCGIDHFEIRRHRFNDYAKLTAAFFLVRIDKTAIQFSYQPCVSGLSDTQEQKINKAARYAVAGDCEKLKRNYFRGEETAICQATGKTITYKEAHVDHSGDWPFSRILDEWLCLIRPRFWHVPLKRQGHCSGNWVFATVEARNHFKKFHDAHAVLKVVSKTYNLSQQNRYKNKRFTVPPEPNGE